MSGKTQADSASDQSVDEALDQLPPHPVGTLAIVLIFGLLFALGWLALYFGVFLPRGATGL